MGPGDGLRLQYRRLLWKLRPFSGATDKGFGRWLLTGAGEEVLDAKEDDWLCLLICVCSEASLRLVLKSLGEEGYLMGWLGSGGCCRMSRRIYDFTIRTAGWPTPLRLTL